MKTTYGKIRSFRPCTKGWQKLLKKTNPKVDMMLEVDLMEIFASNGIIDAVWSLRCWEYQDVCLFACEVAESTLPIFERRYPKDPRPRKAIRAIRDYHKGLISNQELKKAAKGAVAAAAAVNAVANSAAAAVAAWAEAAVWAAKGAYFADYATAYIVAAYTVTAVENTARKEQWGKIETLFLKHFGNVK